MKAKAKAKLPDAVIVAARYRCQNRGALDCGECPMFPVGALCGKTAKAAAARILRAYRAQRAAAQGADHA